VKRAGILIGIVAVALVPLSSTALAAAPTASTGQATSIASTSATLSGTVLPNQEATTYHFEYGATKAYGTSTPDQGPVNGNASKPVTASVSGLAPSTTYHFRLVATNASGTVQGKDAKFKTPAAGQQASGVTIKATPRTVTFGKPTAISGTVTGKNAAGATVDLEQSPFPFSSPFARLTTGSADQAGNYAFAGVLPGVNTHYQVTAKTSPPVTSVIVTVHVRPAVTLRVGDRTPARGQRVRFSGRVTPAHDGKVVRLQRRTGAVWRTISTAVLKPATPVNGVARSRWSRRLKVSRSATYRALFVPGDGDHVRGKSRKRSVHVH
jgi:hypothetical protein